MYDELNSSQGAIILLAHGVSGSNTTFDNMIDIIDGIFPFLNAKTYDGLYIKDGELYNNEILNDLTNNGISYINKKVFIELEFQNNIVGDFDDQATEINNIVTSIKNALGGVSSLFKFILIGHSKGGLVSLKYSIDYPHSVDGIICVNSPLNGPYHSDYILWEIADDITNEYEVYDQINQLIYEWNSQVTLEATKVICLATNYNDTDGDGVVPNSSSLGFGNIHMPGLDRSYRNIYYRTIVSGPGDGYKHKGDQCLANSRVVYQILLMVDKLLLLEEIGHEYEL